MELVDIKEQKDIIKYFENFKTNTMYRRISFHEEIDFSNILKSIINENIDIEDKTIVKLLQKHFLSDDKTNEQNIESIEKCLEDCFDGIKSKEIIKTLITDKL